MAAKRTLAADSESSSPTDDDSNDTKRVKRDAEISADTSSAAVSIHETLRSFDGFVKKEVLQANTNTKTVFLRCGVGKNEGEDAVVILEKTAFSEDDLDRVLTSKTSLGQQLHNDIYGTYRGVLPADINGVKATVIHPATEKHIQKYKSSVAFMILETPEDYNTITRPYIKERTQTSLKWVENILEHKSEADRIVFEDPDPETGFILLPDMKWDRSKVDELYLVAIVHRRGITSLRELNDTHLPLLDNVRNKALTAIKEKFGISKDHLRVFFHYQPSYYHLHVHFTHVRGIGASAFAAVSVEKAHLLDTVIANIHLVPNYYQKVDLTYALKEDELLFKEFVKAGRCFSS